MSKQSKHKEYIFYVLYTKTKGHFMLLASYFIQGYRVYLLVLLYCRHFSRIYYFWE